MLLSWNRLYWKENDRQRNLCVFRGGFEAGNCLVCVRMKEKKITTCYQTARSDLSLILPDFSSTSIGGTGSARGSRSNYRRPYSNTQIMFTLESCESIDWKVLKVYPFSGLYFSSWIPNLKKNALIAIKQHWLTLCLLPPTIMFCVSFLLMLMLLTCCFFS